jgi:EXS family
MDLRRFGELVPIPSNGVERPEAKQLYYHSDSYKWGTLIIPFIPFWFRLMQCFRRYYETKLNANLKNAGKYFTIICVQIAAIPYAF